MSKPKYHFVSQDAKSYTIRHADGKNFQVAKDGLRKEEHSSIGQLPKFAEGGIVEEDTIDVAPDAMAAQTAPPVPSAAPNPNDEAFQARLKQRLAQKGAMYGGEEQIPEASRQEAEAEALQDVASGNQKAEQAKASADAAAAQRTNHIDTLKNSLGIATKAPAQPAPTVPPDQQVAAPGAGQQEQAGPPVPTPQEGVIGKIQGSIDTELGAKQGMAGAQQDALSQSVNSQAKIAERAVANLKEYTSEREKAYREASDVKVEANRYWSNKSTGNKILATISVILGGLGSGRNVGLDIINKAIDQDIDEQKANIGQNNNLYKMYLQKLGDERLAILSTQSQMMAHTAGLMNQAAAVAATPMAKAEALAKEAALGQQVILNDKEVAKARAMQQMLGEGGGNISSTIQSLPETEAKGYRERIVRLPGGKEVLAYSPDARKEVTQVVEAFGPISSLLDRLDSIGAGALLPSGKASDKALAIQASLIPLMNKIAKLGVLSEREHKLLSQQVTDPKSFIQLLGGKAKSNAYRETIDSMLESSMAANIQGHKAPVKIGTPYKGAAK